MFAAFDVIDAFVSAVSEVMELVGGEEARYEGEGGRSGTTSVTLCRCEHAVRLNLPWQGSAVNSTCLHGSIRFSWVVYIAAHICWIRHKNGCRYFFYLLLFYFFSSATVQ